MRIILNGQTKEVAEGLDIAGLLREVDMEKPYVAVSVNMDCIPRSQYTETVLQERDEVEILVPYQGG